MSQHKYNLNVQLAKEGKLPPKKAKLSKKELYYLVRKAMQKSMFKLGRGTGKQIDLTEVFGARNEERVFKEITRKGIQNEN